MALKLKQQIIGECGEISLELSRDMSEEEIVFLTKVLVALVNGQPLKAVLYNEIINNRIQEYRIKFFANQKQKINTIKLVRDQIHCGLREAKDMVEGTMDCPWMEKSAHRLLLNLLQVNNISEFVVETREIME